jgi:hypothetical protein
MSRLSTYGSRLCGAGMIGFLAVVPGPGSVCAQDLNVVVRDLNSVLNPNDARRLEDQAYQNGRWDEQRYWHEYGAGLASSNRYRQYYGPDPRDQRRYSARGGYGDWDRYGDRAYGSTRYNYPGDRYYRP